MKSKKGAFPFNIMVVVALTALLIYAWIQLDSKYNGTFERYLGEKQYDLIKTYQKGEQVLFYIDQSAKYSLEQSVYDLAKSGGISEIEVSDAETFAGHECGKFNGAYVWYKIEKQGDKYAPKECFGENFAEINLPYIFNKNLNKYLLNYPYNIPIDNYEFKLNGNLEIIGIAMLPVNINIFKKEVPEDFSTATRDVKPKPLDIKQLDKDTTKPSEGFRDFTGTDLCAKGLSCVLKEDAFQQLVKAQDAAVKKGISIEVYSAYRSSERQQALWNGDTPERYAQRYPDPAVRVKYVCNPAGGEVKCPHLSGDVVDIRLKGKTTGTMSSADWDSLYSIMTSADSNKQPLWVKYSNEPWHFECCNTPRYARAIQQGVTSIV